MSTQTAMVCMKCKEVLNSQDDIFGTSCGHLYHFLCLRECHGRSTNCSHCESYKPCMYKMFLEFGEVPISWEDQTKTIELHNELEDAKLRLVNVEEKHKLSQVSVQKLEGTLKKLNDALKCRDITVSDLEDRIATLEELNKFLSTEVELKERSNGNNNNVEKLEEQSMELSKNQIKKINNKKIQHLSEELENEIAKNAQLTKDNLKLKAFINLTNNGNDKSIIDIPADASVENQNENCEDFIEHCDESEEIEIVKEPSGSNENTEDKIVEENDEQSLSCNQESTTESHTVLIRNFRVKDLKTPLENVVIAIASQMNLQLSASEITRVITINNNRNYTSLNVGFENIQTKQNFLKYKNRLKKSKFTRYLDIQ
ncbi:synaptonemal complex protein 1-like [Calliphora vicina]|uniref:synaptonemal complex protein 1-like n=1 Tax=Calliphora vicina TaxID=7373 RepID=UPI00325ACAC1